VFWNDRLRELRLCTRVPYGLTALETTRFRVLLGKFAN